MHFKFTHFIIAILVVCLFSSGCKEGGLFDGNKKTPAPDIHDLGVTIDNSSKDLDKTTKTIKSNAQDGMKNTPPDAKSVLNVFWANILAAVGTQEQIVKNLVDAKTKADNAESNATKYQKQCEEEHRLRMIAEESATKELKQKYIAYSGILFFLALICLGLAIWSREKIFFFGGGVCGVGCVACIFLVQILSFISWIIGGLLLIVAGLIVYKFWHAGKTGQAVVDLTKTVEAIKPELPADKREELFGKGAMPGDVVRIQKPFTQHLVTNIRNKMRTQDKARPSVA